MKNRDVIFCYYDKEENVIKEVLGHISYLDEASFVNELYYMKLDGTYSQNVFFKMGYTTGDLVSIFKPEFGIVDFNAMADIVCDSTFHNERAERILQSYFEKIQIDEVLRFDVLEYDDIVRNSSNPIFPQPFTHHRVMAESQTIQANTVAYFASHYNFDETQCRQDNEGAVKRPFAYVKVG